MRSWSKTEKTFEQPALPSVNLQSSFIGQKRQLASTCANLHLLAGKKSSAEAQRTVPIPS